MRPTLIFVRHTDFGDRAFPHAAELPPNFLGQEVIDKLLDSGRLKAAFPSSAFNVTIEEVK